jgi:hypothetical protein
MPPASCRTAILIANPAGWPPPSGAGGSPTDFFALGGNSLLAFRLRRRISKDLKAVVDVHDVLTTTVLGELAALLETRKTVRSGDAYR